MNKITNPMVDAYLAELEQELQGLPDAVARDILDGVREELAGLDPQQAAAMIEQLGDPAFIAAEARAAAGPIAAKSHSEPDADAAPGLPAGPRRDTSGSRFRSWGYVVSASLLVALGGAVVPVLGWVAGVVMVWASDAWRTWEKWLATLMPCVTVAAVAGVVFGARMWSEPRRYATYAPFEPSPALSSPSVLMWNLILALAAINCVVGLWLLWRAVAAADTGTPRQFVDRAPL